MPKYGGTSSLCLIDGYDWLTSKPKTMSLKIESITEQTDGLGDPNEAHTPVGKQRFTFSQGGGFFDTATAGLHAAMMAVATGASVTPQAVPRIGVFGCMGNTVAAVFYGIQGMLTTAYELLADNAKLSKANVTYLLDGAIERGQIVQPLAVKTAVWNTKTLGTTVDFTTSPNQVPIPITSNSIAAASVITTPTPHGLSAGHIVLISGVVGSTPTINGERVVTVLSPTTFSVPITTTVGGTGGSFVRSNSLNGGFAYQDITAMSGFSAFVGKVRDSADDTTYADLATMASAAAAPNAQRVAGAGTVDRYLSFDGAPTGSGSITVFAGFSRT